MLICKQFLLILEKVIVKGNQTDAKIQEELAKQQNLLFQDKIRKNREAELEEDDFRKRGRTRNR